MAIDPKIIDHTNLKPEATEKDIKKLCTEAIQHGFGTVCIRPNYVSFAIEFLEYSSVRVCAVIGFPKGLNSTEEKLEEAKKAVEEGADELDMVINTEALRKRDFDYVKNDISSIKKVVNDRTLKVIIEAGILNKKQKIKACQLAEEAGADFIKTSTGFAKDDQGHLLGATIEDVKLIKSIVKDRVGIKASGGIKTSQFAHELLEAGATRIGASASIEILKNSSPLNGNITWKWFEFHADQRLRAFYYYLIMIGALSFGYLTVKKGCPQLQDITPLLCGFAFIVSLVFLFLEIRNVELVNIGRTELRKLNFGPLKNKNVYNEEFKKAIGGKLVWLRPVIKHELCLRVIYLLMAFISLFAFIEYFVESPRFYWKIWGPIVVLIVSLSISILFWRRKE